MARTTAAVRTTLETITTTEARPAVSLGVVVAAVLLGFVIAPIAVRRSVAVTRRLLEERDVERAEAVALEAIESVEHAAPAPKPEVIPTEFADSAITLERRFRIQPPNVRSKWRAKRAVAHAIKTAYDREGITIPYPQRQLSDRAAGAAQNRDDHDVPADDELSFSEGA